jgi:NDP-sugar pyrophosphorylase family protein
MGGFLLDSDILLKAIKEHGYYSIRNGEQIEMPLPQYFLMQKLKLGYAILNEPVLDVGRPFDIISANRLFAEVNNKALSSSYMGSNAKIGKNCIIKGACSIEGTLQDNVIIEDSYIMKGTIIGKDSKIQKSVIGENVIIGNNVSILSEHATIMIKGKKMSPKRTYWKFHRIKFNYI